MVINNKVNGEPWICWLFFCTISIRKALLYYTLDGSNGSGSNDVKRKSVPFSGSQNDGSRRFAGPKPRLHAVVL